MKANVVRVVCLLLALMMAVSLFAGCGKEEAETATDVSSVASTATTPSTNSGDNLDDVLLDDVIVDIEGEPYTINQSADGKDIIIPTFGANNETVLSVAEKTTLAQFLACVMPKEGYTVKVMDAAGAEITDVNTELVAGMVFNVYKDGETTPVKAIAIDVVAQSVIDDTIKDQQEIDDQNDEVKDMMKDEEEDANNTTAVPLRFTINLSSIWNSSYTGSDNVAKAWQSTLSNMEKRQGIKTNVTGLDAQSATDTIVKDVMAGKVTADIYDVSLQMCRNIARKKAAANIYDSKTFDKANYQCGATESVTFSGKAYGVTFAQKSVNPMGVIYNKKIIAKYAPETDIVKLYNSKQWTFETFQALAKKCTHDTNGDGKTDIYGFTSNTNIIGMALTSNAGGTALMNSKGRVEATMCNADGVAALEWCKTLFKTERSWLFKADISACADAFAGGQSAMFVSYLAFFNTIAPKADFEMGFVLMPMGPAQKDYINSVYDAQLYVVPKTNEKRLDDIGEWLNGIYKVNGKLLNEQISKLKKNGMDSTCITIYKSLVNNMSAEFSTGAFTSNISSQVDSSVTSASKSPTKVMAAIKDAAQKECDDFYGPLY